MATTIELDESPVYTRVTITQGDDWTQELRLATRASSSSPLDYIDMTGWEGHAQIRAKVHDKEEGQPPLAELVVTIDPDQSDEDKKGLFTIHLAKEESISLPPKAIWDLEFDRPEGRRTYFSGPFLVLREVTFE